MQENAGAVTIGKFVVQPGTAGLAEMTCVGPFPTLSR